MPQDRDPQARLYMHRLMCGHEPTPTHAERPARTRPNPSQVREGRLHMYRLMSGGDVPEGRGA
ncbi:hypothetical protein GCM10012286_79790 [Streptomyces lasiicapitis]|uniref:Uncharacterized protein n=1 Tax=Streptomyces lasiicapitis TaxID=1923961 RepID=A0ABQ2MWH2_9ACTN|nr:hypothetical protein GCM10012286_79790 [Streptomyces lasiicapitis]